MRKQNKYKIIVISLLVTTAFLSCSCALAQETLRERIRQRRLDKIKQKLSPPPYHSERLQVLEFGARKRTYLLHIPPCYKKGIPIPLVLAFHGGGGTAEAAEMQSGLSKKAEEACFIVVYPDGVSKFGIPGRRQYWASGTARTESRSEGIDDVGFISVLIDKLSQEYSIDPKMIYATGLSNGAQMCYRLACELSDKIAAIAPIGSGMVVEDCKPLRPVPIMHFHGTADPGWPYNGGPGCFTTDTFSPVSETINKWITINNCSDNAHVTYQKGEAVCRTYGPCGENAEVTLCTIDGGGHVWPGGYAFPSEQKIPWDSECALGKGNGVGRITQDINSVDAMWEFFKRHPLIEASALSVTAGDYDFSLKHDGLVRTYRVHVPPRHDDFTPMPVVIYIHGGAGDKRAAYMDGMDKMSDKHGFILAIPEGTGEVKHGHLRGGWNGGNWATGECCGNADDVGFISKMIDEIKQKFNVDEKRIYATGISNGGLMTNRLGCELADKIAAIAPVAPAAIISNCNPSRPMPVMDIHGTADPANPPDGSEPRSIFRKGSRSGFDMSYKRMTPYQVVDAWKSINKCSDKQVMGYQNGGAKCIIYNECTADAEVELCMVEGMGHTWPSGSQYFPASIVGPVSYDISFDQIWEFFKKHPRQTGFDLLSKYNNKEYGFSINYPAEYIMQEPEGWDKLFEVFRARSPKKLPLLTATILYVEDGTPYEEILSIWKDLQRMKAITEIEVGPKKDILLSDGTLAWQTVISFKAKGYNIKTLNLWVQKYNRWFMVTLTIIPTLWPGHIAEMESIINSFTPPTRKPEGVVDYVTFKAKARMRDGKDLSVYVVLPPDANLDAAKPKPYPIIFWYTGYGARYSKLTIMATGKDDPFWGPDARANYGFVIVSQRGRFENEKAWYRGAPPQGQDGADIVEWIDKQPWSGKIGMWGWGADGNVVYETARENPKGLTAMFPQFAPWLTEDYTRFYPGGVLREANMVFMDDQWPGQWKEITVHPAWDRYWDNKFVDRPKAKDIKIPISVDNGWFAHNINHLFRTYEELREKSPLGANTKIIIGPWSHMYPGVLKQGDLEYPKAAKQERAFYRRFFDYWLKGDDNGFDKEGPIYYYQMGEETWKWAKKWPPEGTREIKYYLHDGADKYNALLSTAPIGQDERNRYIFDPKDPSPAVGGPFLWPTNKFPDVVSGPAYQDNKVLTNRDDYQIYETPILTEDLEVAGNPSVRLYIEANTPDTDIIIRLADYDPNAPKGKQTLLVGIAPQRMRYRESLRNPIWMESGKVYEVNIKIDPLAYTWKKGHQVRLIVSSSAYPLYAINPNNKNHFMWDKGELLVAEVKLWSNSNYPSYLLLPSNSGTSSVE